MMFLSVFRDSKLKRDKVLLDHPIQLENLFPLDSFLREGKRRETFVLGGHRWEDLYTEVFHFIDEIIESQERL